MELDEATLSVTKHLGKQIIESVGFNLRSLQRLSFTEKLGKFFITCHKGRRKFRKTDRIVVNELEPVLIKSIDVSVIYSCFIVPITFM